jgi:LmbE family N-acetylglucosaminyl deacetylase
MDGGVLAVFAHPDDESLLAGGTLAACAAAGRRVAVVSMTRGERGPGASSELGEIREAELRAAAHALGAAAARCLAHPDGELADVDEAEVATELAHLLEHERPEVLITFSEEGLYWHPDHLAVPRLIERALDVAPAGPQWVYGATWPTGHARRLVAEAHARGLATDLWGLEPDAFGAPAESITSSVDVTPFLPAKLAALRAYASQIRSGHVLSALPDDLAAEFLGREYFVRLRPEQAERDWLAEVV